MAENEVAEQSQTEVKTPQQLAALLSESAENPKPLPNPFYDDGYTRTVTIPSDLTGFAPVKIAYRPITADEDSRANAFLRMNGDKPAIDHYGPLLASKILDWDLKNAKGEKLQVTDANIRRTPPEFYAALIKVVSGQTPLADADGNFGPTLKNS